MELNPTKLNLEVTYAPDNGMLFERIVFTEDNLNSLMSKLENMDVSPFAVSPFAAREAGDFWTEENVLLLVRTAVMYSMCTSRVEDHVFGFFIEGGADWLAVRLNTAQAVSVWADGEET